MAGLADGSRGDHSPVRAEVPRGPLLGWAGLVGLLCALALVPGLGPRAWAVGLGCGVVLTALLVRSLRHDHRPRLGPADRVTLVRAVLACGVAALAVEAVEDSAATPVLVTLAAVAIALDGVDGRVARRTGTASAFGARFDMEVDAFLILILSASVAWTAGWWVLCLGLARYAFLGAGALLPWLRDSPPPRRWAKVVAVVVALVLLVAASGVLPTTLTGVALLVAVALLAESFGRSVGQLWCLHRGRPLPGAGVGAALALVALWVALLVPDRLDSLAPDAFLRVPVEGLLFIGIVVLLPPRGARTVAVLGGLALGVLTILRILDLGFQVAFDAPFHLVFDWDYAGSALGLLPDSIGRAGALAAAAGVALLAVAMLTLLPLAALRLSGLAAAHRRPTIGTLALLCAVIGVTAASGAVLGHATPAISTTAAGAAYTQVTRVRDDLRDQRTFAHAMSRTDPFATAPADDLLRRLRGKDVLLVFVESYGRSALRVPVVEQALASGNRRLSDAGLAARSGWLTSPTFGGLSWLAHSTLQSGLWVDNQQRYDRLLTGQRLTLTSAFGRAGWRTVAVAPAIPGAWPEGSRFYHYDQVYDQTNLGYAGPPFGWAAMPDQYTLAAFQRLELDVAGRGPVMAQITLVSSHWPWAPLPRLVGWNRLGDGSIFVPMAAEGTSAKTLARDPALVRQAYADAIAYSLDALTSFLERRNDPDLVVVVLGDHQPSSLVSGEAATRDVPVSIIAHDPAVLGRAAAWGWADGLRPDDQATTWPMDAFRDRFLTAFSVDPPALLANSRP